MLSFMGIFSILFTNDVSDSLCSPIKNKNDVGVEYVSDKFIELSRGLGRRTQGTTEK